VPGVFVAGDATTVPFKRSSLWQATVPRQRWVHLIDAHPVFA
jgi:hypothetical protein